MNFSKTKKLLYVLLLCFVSAICTFVSACSTTNVAKPNAISVTFNQGEEVIYETDSLEKLRPLLEVKQAFESGKEEVTNKYLLTGSLEVPNGDEPQEVCVTVTLQANKDICTTITVMVTAVNHTCVFEEENSFVSKHPTCTEEGEKTYICECGETKTEVIEKSAHVYGSYKSDHVANCTKNDTQTATCKNCGATDVKEIAGTALGHNFEETVYAWTQSGKSYACTASAKCARCKEVFVANASVDEVVTSGTCETEGSIRYTATFNFGEGETAFPVEAQIKDVATAILGHDYKVVVTAPTCTTIGYTTYTCQRVGCNDTYTDSEVVALGHDYNAVVTAPTCTEEGYTTHTCSRCSDTYTDSEVSALGHAYGAWVSNGNDTHTKVCANDNSHTVTEECSGGSATCTEKAICVDCHSAHGSALGHAYGAWVSNGNDTHTKVCANDNSHTVTEECTGGSATCTEKAICVDCHSAHGSALGHAYGAASYVWAEDYSSCTATRVCSRDNNHIETETVDSTAVTTPAKCEENGKIVYTTAAFANAAFAAQTHTTVLDKIGHNYNAVVTAPTCTEEGYTTHTCSRCSDVYTDSKVAATGHDYKLNVCQNDNSHVLSYQEVLDLAYGLAESQFLEGTYKLEGVILSVDEVYSTQFKNITVTMVVEGNTQKAMKCFRLKGTGADLIGVGDTIVVTGVIKNHYGTIEFDSGCVIESYEIHTCSASVDYEYDADNHWNNCVICGKQMNIGEHTFVDGACTGCGVDISVKNTVSATLSFVSKNQRTELSATKQVWEQNGIILTNNKGSSTSSVADYANPARFYKSSQIIIEIKGISKIVFDCNSVDYATALKNSIQSGNVTISSDKVTVEFDERVDSFTIAKLSAQVRMDGLTVTYVKDCEHEIKVAIGKAKDATCTEAGITAGEKCLLCGKTLVAQEELAALGHSWVDATCTEPKTCSVCGTTEGEALGHDIVVDEAVAPTCTEAGKTAGSHCGRCDAVLVAQEEVAALGHTEVVDEAVDPTCTATGLTEGKHCSVCEAVLVPQTVVPATGHKDENVDSRCDTCGTSLCVTHTWVDATCTEPKTCSVCGDTEGEIDANNHAYGAVSYVWAEDHSSCTATRICSHNNSHTEIETATATFVETEATCEQDGSIVYTANFANAAFETQTYTQVLVATGHTEETILAVEATCIATGLTAGVKCSVCGEILTAQTETPINESNHAKEATYTIDGNYHSKSYECCGTEEDPALHNFVKGVCECGKNIILNINENKTATISFTSTAQRTELTTSKQVWANGGVTLTNNKDASSTNVADYSNPARFYKGSNIVIETSGNISQIVFDCTGIGNDYINAWNVSVDGATVKVDTTNKKVTITLTASAKSITISLTGGQARAKSVNVSYGYSQYCDHDGKIVPVEGTAPTCTTTGLTAGSKCSACDTVAISQDVIPMLPHTEVVDEAVAPTCTEAGKTEGKHCSVCNKVLVAQTVVDATGHKDTDADNACDACGEPMCTEHVWTEATCEEGSVCQNCGVPGEVEALGHNYGNWASNGAGQHIRVCKNDPAHIETQSCSGGTKQTCKGYICATCGDYYGTAKADAHEYGNDNKCIHCGEVKPAAQPVTVTLSSFSKTSASMDSVASYSTAKGGGTTAPAINGGQIRLYQNSAGTGGGTITIKVPAGYKIQSITIGSAMKTSIAYTEGTSTTKSTSASLAANEKYTYTTSGDITSVTFHCMGKDKNSRLYVNYLSVTYIEV